MTASLPAERPIPPSPAEDMIALPGGEFLMGADNFYPEEAPCRRVKVGPFQIDKTPVTNRHFADFVAATGHVTLAEIAPDPKDYPGLSPSDAIAGSAVFQRTDRPVPLHDASQWWQFVPGADWRHPTGSDSNIDGLEDHPVVHVAFADAKAYADWAGKALPTEAEWEYAARAGAEGDYSWGDELAPGGDMLANYWQGLFPYSNLMLDGWERTSPVGTFPANGFGLFDMIGNVWEWTSDWYALPSTRKGVKKGSRAKSCCSAAVDPRGATLRESFDPAAPHLRIGRKVIKGGSYLCAASYCQRYRPAARHPQMLESPTGHIGFRCVRRAPPGNGR